MLTHACLPHAYIHGVRVGRPGEQTQTAQQSIYSPKIKFWPENVQSVEVYLLVVLNESIAELKEKIGNKKPKSFKRYVRSWYVVTAGSLSHFLSAGITMKKEIHSSSCEMEGRFLVETHHCASCG